MEEHKVQTPHFPLYSHVSELLVIFSGTPKATVRGLINATSSQMGTPQNPVDWSDPNTWIPARLTGDEAKLAQRIWDESHHRVNPRHIYGVYSFINIYGLLSCDQDDIYQLTEKGKAFLKHEIKTVRELDDAEGLLQLLTILATKGRAKRSDLLNEWGDFLHEYSLFGSDSMVKITLQRRLGNLVERGLVLRAGNTYTISPEGVEYAISASPHHVKKESDTTRNVYVAIKEFNTQARDKLRDYLSHMPPYQFEHLVRDLLEAIGYEDVTVTKESGDRGVDVVATVQFGITTITEVVQVKRHKEAINRPVLDQLRGALPYYKALRGTIITLGSFSKGCIEAALFPGAAPIGLIDGEKLLDLLTEHKIGVKKQSISLDEVDEGYFKEQSTDEDSQTLDTKVTIA